MTITVKSYIDAAIAKGWKYEWIDEERNVVALYPPNEEPIIIRNNVTELATAIGSVVSSYKSVGVTLAEKVGFAVPATIVIEEVDQPQKALDLLHQTGHIVVKPMDGAYGDGVSTNVKTEDELVRAVQIARQHTVKSKAVVAQEFCRGRDFRLFLLDGELVGAIERVPFMVKGDGQHSLKELLESKLASNAAKEDHKIKPVDLEITSLLAHISDYKPTDIPPVDQVIVAQGVANLSKGGEALDVTEQVHPQIVKKAVALARLIRLDMCGVDILSDDISQDTGAVFLEINVAPGFRGHAHPAVGQPRLLAPLILDKILQKRTEKQVLQKVEK